MEDINKLKQENIKLTKELEFYKKIHEHSNSLVCHMIIKHINGNPIWIDTQKISTNKELLLSLDKDDDVEFWINNNDIRYKDNDW
jgi:hypothetical protein|tara:strand:- start:289 stop:543 length:255 start_codon:yes stop_codon:yes gene_type:complete